MLSIRSGKLRVRPDNPKEKPKELPEKLSPAIESSLIVFVRLFSSDVAVSFSSCTSFEGAVKGVSILFSPGETSADAFPDAPTSMPTMVDTLDIVRSVTLDSVGMNALLNAT